MKVKLLSVLAILLIIGYSVAGQDVAPAPVDSLKQFAYLYKGQPMPFDSGVAMSERQYSYLVKQSIYTDLESRLSNATKPVPNIVYVETEKRKKGDGNKGVWFGIGVAAGAIIATIAAIMPR